VDDVKRGILIAGGFPVDGAVLMGGCDKTTPGLLLGATSMNIPAIFLPAGPMLRGNFQGKFLGSGSDSWKYWDELRAGKITDRDWLGVEQGIARFYGTCMTMGTASTMTAIAEAVGMVLPGGSSVLAADAGHIRLASESGRRIVEMVWEDLTPQKIQTRPAFENAIAVAMAMGCSTNAIIHLIAMARRAGQDIGLANFGKYNRPVPVIGNVRPTGSQYLIEDFFYAGGIRALIGNIKQHLQLDCLTVSGKTIGENIESAQVFNDDVIRPLDKPIYEEGSLAVLTGNLAPDGCVIKPKSKRQFADTKQVGSLGLAQLGSLPAAKNILKTHPTYALVYARPVHSCPLSTGQLGPDTSRATKPGHSTSERHKAAPRLPPPPFLA
jgi:dihydroxyacid dehydratase/phosphogluconate dehydratase